MALKCKHVTALTFLEGLLLFFVVLALGLLVHSSFAIYLCILGSFYSFEVRQV